MKVLVVGGFGGTQRLQRDLRAAGFDLLGPVPSTSNLYRIADEYRLAAIMVAADSPARDCAEAIAMSSPQAPQPCVTSKSSERWPVAFYLAPVLPRTLRQRLIELGLAHFQMQEIIARDRESQRSQGDRPNPIAQAKQSLMARDGLSEDEAYHRLRRTAMERGQRIADIARTVLQEMGEKPLVGTEVAV